MATVSERLKDRFSQAKTQFIGFENKVKQDLGQVEKKVIEEIGQLETKAKASLDEVPAQLKGAWGTVVGRVRGALDFASKAEFKVLSSKVDDLAKKVDRIVREKVAAAKDKASKHVS